ncbi:MAG: methyltransferase domain-containing protein [Candidatus Binataceae bacterium]
MDWRLKVALHWLISSMPFNHKVQFAFQWLNGSLPVSDQTLEEIIADARRHAQTLGTSRDGVLFEFGAGWDLAQPLVMWALGYQRQVLVDIRRLARASLVTDIALRLQQRGLASIAPSHRLENLRAHGIRYIAPADARATDLPDASISYIVSTNTLEHIPAGDIAAIFSECRRILAAGGVMSLIIDYQDHWSYADPSLQRFNFRRYSERTWRFLNPPTHWQNRLQHSDYVALLEQGGFYITRAVVNRGQTGAHIVACKV